MEVLAHGQRFLRSAFLNNDTGTCASNCVMNFGVSIELPLRFMSWFDALKYCWSSRSAAMTIIVHQLPNCGRQGCSIHNNGDTDGNWGRTCHETVKIRNNYIL